MSYRGLVWLAVSTISYYAGLALLGVFYNAKLAIEIFLVGGALGFVFWFVAVMRLAALERSESCEFPTAKVHR